jgi:hypothetical protein
MIEYMDDTMILYDRLLIPDISPAASAAREEVDLIPDAEEELMAPMIDAYGSLFSASSYGL